MLQMTVCCSSCYTSIIHCFSSLTSRILFWAQSTAALSFRLCCHRLQTWAVKVASYLARWILRSHMQYVIENGSSCDFQVSQGSVVTKLGWGGRPCNSYIQFPWESGSERILKIGLYTFAEGK